MIRTGQAPPFTLLLLLILGACASDRGDVCRVAPPADPQAYRSSLESERRRRDQWFRTSEESPVPAARRAKWGGLQYFPVDVRFRFEGPLIRKTSERRFSIATTSSELRPCLEVGYFQLDLGAGLEKLPVYELLDQEPEQRSLFVPFMDATTGEESYPAGRYLEVQPAKRGSYLLDFNRAYNPSCAYGGTDFQCPITPPQNRLRAAVRAGETGYDRSEVIEDTAG